MHPALDQLHKIVKLEQTNGYQNKAVIGGLPKLLVFWEPNARRAGLDAAFIEAIAAKLRAYPDVPDADRPSAVQDMLRMVREAAGPETSVPPPAAAPAAPRPTERVERVERAVLPPKAPPAEPGATRAPEERPREERRPRDERRRDDRPREQFGPRPEPRQPAPPPAQPGETASLPETPMRAAPGPDAPEDVAGAPNVPSANPPVEAASAQPVRAPRPPRPPKPPKAPQQPLPPRRRMEVDYGEEPVDPRPRRPQGAKPVRAAVPLNSAAGVDAPLTVLNGIGPETAKLFERLEIFTLHDLLLHFPSRYDDYSRMKTINRLELGEECSVIATVWEATLRPIRGGRQKMLKVVLSDGTGALEVTFFNQEWLAKSLTPGRQIVISGRIDQYLGRLTIVPDEWEDVDRELLSTGRIVPVYRATADLKQKTIRKASAQVISYWAAREADPLPPAVTASAGVMPYGDALAQIHYPDTRERLADAQHRLAFDELLLLQLGALRQRRDWQAHTGQSLAAPAGWLEEFKATLPYTLTGAQQRAVAEITADMARDVPMNRLLQGDVGSGKTMVAAIAMATAIQAGTQAALMAPTSILAEQHYRTLLRLLAPVVGGPEAAQEQVRLLQGANTAMEKQAIYDGLRSGAIQAVVGTHALIEGPVEFANLGLVIVDEQHRFGVAQRAALRGKGGNPHLLVMTATPIPRSLCLTVYGDLDLTVLDEMPPGRQPIRTVLVTAKERERGYAYIRNQLAQGRQAFLIFPLVEESDKIDAKAAVAEHTRLQAEVFNDYKLGLLHGRMKPDEKDAVMAAFRAREYDVLVSTSVVEVGVDVPNATVILIDGANRFGLAQLHQFRGRVGRGEHASMCILVSDAPQSQTDPRLQIMEQSQDGFVLAQKDLELRGPGDFLGTRQAGLATLHMARLSDLATVEKARRVASEIFAHDPDLTTPDHQALAARLAAFWQPGAGDAS